MKNKSFVVDVQELWTQAVRVKAESKEEALDKVLNGEGDYINDTFEYRETNPLNNAEDWDVEEE